MSRLIGARPEKIRRRLRSYVDHHVIVVRAADGTRREERQMLDLMDRAISQLREPRRDVVRMHLAGYGREEIAELLDCSEATTREALARGMADLRTTLIGMGIRPEGWL